MLKQRLTALCSTLLALTLLAACAPAPTGGNTVTPTETPATISPAPTPTPSEAGADDEESPGIMSTFTTADLDGTELDQSMLTDYKLTMVNVWATYCSPCLDEMPDLGEIHSDYSDRAFQVVGLVSDVLNQDGTLSDSQIDLAKDIVAETKADYPHIVPTQDLYPILSQVTAVPLTFFVDAEGNQVGSAYAGARSKNQWIEIIEPLLEEVGA